MPRSGTAAREHVFSEPTHPHALTDALTRALWRTVLLVAGLYLLAMYFGAVGRTVLLFFVAFLLAVALNIPVRFMERRWHMPRALATVVTVTALIALLWLVGMFLGPPLVDRATTLWNQAPALVQRLQDRVTGMIHRFPQVQMALDRVVTPARVSEVVTRAGQSLLGLLYAPIAGFLVLILSLYLVITPQPLVRGLLRAVPPARRPDAVRCSAHILTQLEAWVRGTLILMVIVGFSCGVGLWALGVPDYQLFGVLCGLGEGLPTLGPILSAVPPILVMLADDPMKALWVALMFLVVQQVENTLLVPLILGRTVSLHPISLLFLMVTLGLLFGVLGAFVAVPVGLIIKAIWDEFYLRPRDAYDDGSDLDKAVDQVLNGAPATAPSAAPPVPEHRSPERG